MTGKRHADQGEAPPVGRRPHAVAFVEAAVALADAEVDIDAQRRLEHVAAAQLVRLGELGASEWLAAALRPDPADRRVVWTVACYQIGDLVPCSLRDFRNAAAAVQALAECPEASHVAAELLASSTSGLRWTALVRTGYQIAYQAPTEKSASCASNASPDVLRLALDRWAERISRWGALDVGVGPGRDVFCEGAGPGPLVAVGDTEALVSEVLGAIQRLDGRLRVQDELAEQVQARLAAIDDRLARLEQRLVPAPAGADQLALTLESGARDICDDLPSVDAASR